MRTTLHNIREFLFAGNAIFTVENTKTGNHVTYRVQACEHKPTLYFVQVLTGPDNMSSYAYLGLLRGQTVRPAGHAQTWAYAHGSKSRISRDAQSAKVFEWLWTHMDRLPSFVVVHHEGRCGRCARTLTVPESIQSGFGPECMKYVAGAA